MRDWSSDVCSSDLDQAPHALFNSLILAAGAASAGVILGTLVAYLRERTNTPGRGFLAWLAALPYAVLAPFSPWASSWPSPSQSH